MQIWVDGKPMEWKYAFAGVKFRAANVTFDTREHGQLRYRQSKSWDVRLLYAPGDGERRDETWKRFGLEITRGFAKGVAGEWSVGWDGENVLVTLLLGLGAPVSFGGAAPAAEDIVRP